MYLGTSAERAAYLLAMGWDSALPYTSLEDARIQATKHALVDGGYGVVIQVADSALHIDTLPVDALATYEVVSQELPLQSRLGYAETADLGGVLSGLLTVFKTAHDHLINAINTGRGEKDAGISDAFRGLHEKIQDRKRRADRDAARKNRKGKSNDDDDWDDDDLDDALDDIKNAAKKSKYDKDVQRKVAKVHKHLQQMRQKFKKLKSMTQKPAAKVPPKAVVKKAPLKKGPVKKPLAKNKPLNRRPVGKPANPTRTARKDVTVRGKINGRPATTTVRKGMPYKLVKTPKGLVLRRKSGGHGIFVVSPSDAGKLK